MSGKTQAHGECQPHIYQDIAQEVITERKQPRTVFEHRYPGPDGIRGSAVANPNHRAPDKFLDDIAGRAALHSLAPYDDRKLSTLSGKDLVKVADALDLLILPVYRERQRRKEAARGKAKLRLAAEGGYLTTYGRRHVAALKGTATRRAAQDVTR